MLEGGVEKGAVELFRWYLPYAAGVLPRRQYSVALSLVPRHVAGAAADAAMGHVVAPELSSPPLEIKHKSIYTNTIYFTVYIIKPSTT